MKNFLKTKIGYKKFSIRNVRYNNDVLPIMKLTVKSKLYL